MERGQEALNHWPLPSQASWAGAGQQKGEQAWAMGDPEGGMALGGHRPGAGTCHECMNWGLSLSPRLEVSVPRAAKGPLKSNSQVHQGPIDLYLRSNLVGEGWRHVSHGPGP